MTLLSENRYVRTELTAPTPEALLASDAETNVPSAAFSNVGLNLSRAIDWSEVNGFTPGSTTGSANQTVSVSPAHISLNHSIEVRAGGDPFGIYLPPGSTGTALSECFFEVQFTIASPVTYQYDFDFLEAAVLQTAEVVLSAPGFGQLNLNRTFANPSSGLLQPNTYTLRGRLIGAASGDQIGTVSSSFNLELIPEPATAMLTALGLVCIRWFRRR